MRTSIDMSYPFRGSWLVQNSPASRVPSHCTRALATSYAIDFVPVTEDGRTAPLTLGALMRPEPAEKFPGFGRPILAPADGVVVATHEGEPDHAAYRGLPSIHYALTQHRRVASGWVALAGNCVVIERSGIMIALCHLRRGSITVRPGQQVHVGEVLAGCGNSGNSTEPHVHVQAIDHPDVARARAVPLTFDGGLPSNGEIIHV
ncbi:MAG TPA: M23 family metallopeptidase [Candidatus Nesterenkonia stercoripullorum]|uniref:M23 family metallopeptidase n=1 Tax=Candidatus Nesterenkonia stercoripullorum TaxID=2838701 RepID=A0A9D1US34_9MICC|nr:M23 family metallopeptidase [Candidatus Nesterenkonia stercoripullorum]